MIGGFSLCGVPFLRKFTSTRNRADFLRMTAKNKWGESKNKCWFSSQCSGSKFTAQHLFFTFTKQIIMSNVKFTGVNIAAALLVLGFFFPWVSILGSASMSGFSIVSTGISPGMLSMFIQGLDRLLMVLILVVPLSGALILYQNISGNKKFDRFYKPAHFIPAVTIVAGLILLYFKMKPDAPAESFGGYDPTRNMSRSLGDLSPGLFDIMGFGVYLSLAAALYLLLVSMGKVKDKEYYKPATAANTNTVSAVDTPAKEEEKI